MARLRMAAIAVLLIGATLTPTSSAEAWLRDPYARWQSSFNYCFVTSPASAVLNSSQKQRFRDGVQSWRVRAVLTGTETTCGAGVVQVKMGDLGTVGGTFGRTSFDPLTGAVTSVVFDDNEAWYNGTGKSALQTVDFFSVATHEVGHVWGVWHGCTTCRTPEDPEYPTMNEICRCGYTDQDLMIEGRSLTSDDEAGAHFIQDQRILPNHGFEHFQDSSGVAETVPAWYWKGVGLARQCGDGLAQQGSCHVMTHTAGSYIRMQLRHQMPISGNGNFFSFYARVGGTANARIRVEIKDVTTNEVLANPSFTIPGGAGPWQVYSFNWTSISGELHVYQFALFSELASPYTRIDYLTWRD